MMKETDIFGRSNINMKLVFRDKNKGILTGKARSRIICYVLDSTATSPLCDNIPD